MRTFDRLSSNRAFSWLRGEAGRARRAMMTQPLSVRLGLVLSPILLLAGAGYWAAGTLTPSGPRYVALAQGRAFSSDDLITVLQEFDAKGITYRPDDRKIEVAAEQYEAAMAIFAKLKVGPRTVREIRQASSSLAELLKTPGDREQEDRLHREETIERFIDGLDGVVWSVVSIKYPRRDFPRASRGKPAAFVYLETESDRPLPWQTIQAIPKFLTGYDPELGAEAIAVMDRKGRDYLDPTNPKLGRFTQDRVREQEVRDEVVDRLNWIKGVQIWVEVGDREAKVHAPAGQGQPAPGEHDSTGPADRTPAIAVNRPADLGEASPTPAPALAEKPEVGHVLVSVPRSYYYSRIVRHPEHREPTYDEMREASGRTKEQIERIVRTLIPASWTLDVEMIADELPAAPVVAMPAAPDHRRFAADWGIIGAAAAAVALVLAMGSWIQAARRPVRAIAAAPSGRRYREDAADEPEPSERVRELVRRDPEVAASVLQRWATQGGPAS